MVSVRNIEILQSVNSSSSTIFVSTNDEVNVSINEVTDKLNEVEQELALSQNMLEIAQAKELYTQGVLTAKISEHLHAEAELATKNQITSAEVARTANEVRIAEQEYEEAKQSRHRIEERVELVNRTHYNCNELLEYLQTIFSSSLASFDSLYQTLNIRLNNAESILESYLSQDYSNPSIEQQQDVVTEKYQYQLYQYKQGKISKEELNKAYIEKLNRQKENFRESQYAQSENVKISKYGLPEFESGCDVFIKPKDYDKSRVQHFRVANIHLKNKVEEDEELRNFFTNRQLKQIHIGKNRRIYLAS